LVAHAHPKISTNENQADYWMMSSSGVKRRQAAHAHPTISTNENLADFWMMSSDVKAPINFNQ
jgi:hypothetical protein